jgi:cation transport ATPase
MALIAAIEEVGYGAALGERSAEQMVQLLQRKEELKSLRSSFIGTAKLSCAIASIESLRIFLPSTASGLQYNEILRLIALVLVCWIQCFDCRWIHRSAWARGAQGLFTMDTLISLSLLVGLSLSIFNLSLRGMEGGQTYFTSGSFLATVITAGRYLDTLLKQKSMANFTTLYKMQAEAALVKVATDGTYVQASLLRPQQQIVLQPAKVIPATAMSS